MNSYYVEYLQNIDKYAPRAHVYSRRGKNLTELLEPCLWNDDSLMCLWYAFLPKTQLLRQTTGGFGFLFSHGNAPRRWYLQGYPLGRDKASKEVVKRRTCQGRLWWQERGTDSRCCTDLVARCATMRNVRC